MYYVCDDDGILAEFTSEWDAQAYIEANDFKDVWISEEI